MKSVNNPNFPVIGKEFGLEGEKLLEFVEKQQKVKEERKREQEEKRREKKNVDNWKRKKKKSVGS